MDRANVFYTQQVGFVEDVDVSPADGVRIAQLTPPGSACSILLSTGLPNLTEMVPGTIPTCDLHRRAGHRCVTRSAIAAGVDIESVMDVGGGVKYAAFHDPDGNSLVPQEMAWRTGDAF